MNIYTCLRNADIDFIGMSLGITRSFKTHVRHYHLLATDCYMTCKVSKALQAHKWNQWRQVELNKNMITNEELGILFFFTDSYLIRCLKFN